MLDGRVSSEKLNELLALQAEYPELDFKQKIDVSSTAGLIELAKDVGAMQVAGGYIIAGVDGGGTAAAGMAGADTRLFDEATLVPKLLGYLPEPLQLRSAVLERDGHTVVLIYVGRHPSGCAIFHTTGQYERKGTMKVVFRAGEVFWRDGTRSVRISQQGFEEIIERRLGDAKSGWLEEQHELRRSERAELQAAFESRGLADAALGSVNLDLPTATLNLAVLELIRAGDAIGLRHVLNEAEARARSAVERDEIETELADVLDKLTCLAATLLEYEQQEWFERIVGTLSRIYSSPLGPHDARRFGYATGIASTERAPRVWLQVITRVYGLGALAVRKSDWPAVRTLTLQLPQRLERDYDANWLRHALTMASRAQHLQAQEGGRTVELSLLSLVRKDVERLACLRNDGLSPEDDSVISSLAQFDVLSNLAAIDGAASAEPHVFYPNFARFRQERIQPVVDLLLTDQEMRGVIFERGDEDLAIALSRIGQVAHREGFRYDGFWGWDRTSAKDFIAKNLPAQPES